MNAHTVYSRMITPSSAVKSSVMELQNDMVPNFSFVMIYLGLNKTAGELGIKTHHIFANESPDVVKLYKAMDGLDGPFNLGMLCPNITVPDCSPEGTCILSISVPIQGSVLEGMSQKEYIKFKDNFANRIIKSAEKLLQTDLFPYIEEIEIATPETLARYCGLPNGGLVFKMTGKSLTSSLKSTSLSNTDENNDYINGLNFVGQFASGIGYPNVITVIDFGEQIAQIMTGGK